VAPHRAPTARNRVPLQHSERQRRAARGLPWAWTSTAPSGVHSGTMPRLCTLHLVRHGETAHRNNVVQGHLNYDLTPIGINQATATRARFRERKYWQAHCSDLARAYRTAEIIMLDHPEVALSKTPLLREFGLGAQEGLPRGTSRSEAHRIRAAEAGVPPEDYVESLRESEADVQKRAQQFLDTLIADAVGVEAEGDGGDVGRSDHAGGSTNAAVSAAEDGDSDARLVLIVSHGGILNIMMLIVMGLREAEVMGNCAVSVVDVYEEENGVRYVARTLNDVSHFEKSELPTAGEIDIVQATRRGKVAPIVLFALLLGLLLFFFVGPPVF
ncbi:unnamed protein product, partial [Scytosiphon promiscuus]